MDLRSTQLKDTYGNLLTIGTTAGSPTTGTLENGDGEDITSLTIAGTTDATLKIDSNRSDIILSEGDTTDENTLIRQQSSLFRIDTVADDLTTATRRFTLDHSSGDISFRDTSDNPSFYWDASAGSLGIGTTSPTEKLQIVDSANDVHVRIGSGNAGINPTLRFHGKNTADTTNVYADIRVNPDNQTLGFSGTGTSGGSIEQDALVIDSSGNVGIGVSPAEKLDIVADSISGLKIGTNAVGGATLTTYQGSTNSNVRQFEINCQNFEVNTGSPTGTSTSTAMTVDSSGNVLVGKTASNYGVEGIELRPTEALITKDGGTVLSLNRLTNDGIIISLAQGNSTVGSIGTVLQSTVQYYYIAGTATGIGFYSGGIYPSTSDGTFSDNAKDLGSVSVRWDDVYATNGTIQTSDINEKQDIEELDDAELRVAQKAKTLLRKFRWKSSVAENENARIHFGIIAQDLEQAFTDEGLDAGRYGMFIKSTWTNEDGEEQTRLGVRYNQLLAFIISAL